MAGTKFQYDESGTTFYYFVLTFMALVLIPVTYFFWPRPTTSTTDKGDADNKSGKRKQQQLRCHCGPCLVKRNILNAKEPSKKVKQIFTKLFIIIAWIVLLGFAYKVTQNIQPDYINFDPFEILLISPTASKADIKKAYHKLSLIYHPDKDTGDEKKFLLITKAYAALTDEVARKNWEEYGNPDGPGAMSFGIALPSWIVEKENSMIVLMVYVLCLMIAMPIGVRWWWSNSSKYGGYKVLLNTTHIYYFFLQKTPSMPLHRVLMVIASSHEFNKKHNNEIVERESDNHKLPLLFKEIQDMKLNNREYPLCLPYSLKARALLYAHLQRLPLQSDTFYLDKQYILCKCPYLIQDFINCAAHLTMLAIAGNIQRGPTLDTIENAMKLSAMLVQGLFKKSPLLQLPHVNDDMLRHFNNRKRNIRTMRDLASMNDTDRRAMLRFLDDHQYEDVLRFLGTLPHLDVDVHPVVLDDEDVGKITAGALVTVTVTLTRRPMSESLDSAGDDGVGGGGRLIDDEIDDDGDDGQQKQQQQQKNSQTSRPNNAKQSNRKKQLKGKKKTQRKGGGAKGGAKMNQTTKVVASTATNAITTTATEDSDLSGDEEAQRQHDHSDHDDGDDYNSDHSNQASDEDDNDHNAGKDNDDDDDDMAYLKQNMPAKKKDVFQTVSKRSHSVHCPLFPEDKQEHWWIYIVDRKSKQTPSLITLPYFMTNLVEREEIELKFTAPRKPGSYHYTVVVRSDSYVDLDYFKPLKLDVKEAPKEIESHPQWDISEEDEDGDDNDDDSAVSDSDLVDDTDTGDDDDDNDNDDGSSVSEAEIINTEDE